MRILLVPVGSRGDVQPLLALGRRLQARGHSIRLACSPNFGAWGRRLGFEVRTYGPDVEVLSREIGSLLRNPFRFAALLRDYFQEHWDGVRYNAEGVDVIVGAGAQGAMSSIAEWKKIPCFYVGYSPQILPSREHPPLPVTAQWLTPMGNGLAFRVLMAGWRVLFGGLVNRERAKLGLPPARDTYRLMFRGSETLLATDPVIAPLPRDAGDMALTQTGPLVYEDAGETLPDEVVRFLERPGPPIVYIGFGSMVSDDPVALTRIVVDAAERASVRAIVSAGWTGLGGGEVPASCLVAGALPHALLFPRVDAAVHHGGSGTTHAAARAGIPQVIVPHLLDQFFWGHRIHRAGLGGTPVPASRLMAGRLAAAIREALAPERVGNARRQGARMRQHDGLALAVERIEAVAATRAVA